MLFAAGMALSNAERQARWRARRNALAKQAVAMEATRGRRGRRARPVDEANDFIREAYTFLADYSHRLEGWRTSTERPKEDCDELANALHYVANELSIIAQRLSGFSD
jgi:hypothetical protein